MASLTFLYSESRGTAVWQITNLGNYFNQSYYVEAGITLQNFTDGTQTIDQDQILDSISAPSTGSSYNTSSKSIELSNWKDGNYVIYGYAKTSTSSTTVEKYYHAGEVELQIEDSGGSGGSGDEIELWDWYASNRTEKAYNAIMNKGKCSDFSYLVWNDMCDKTKKYWAIKGYNWDNTYLSYNKTIMTDSDKTLTAARMNSLNININGKDTGVPIVSSGERVCGQDFITFMKTLNELIKDYNNN